MARRPYGSASRAQISFSSLGRYEELHPHRGVYGGVYRYHLGIEARGTRAAHFVQYCVTT